MKKIAYKFFITIAEIYWALFGRRISVFGTNLRVTPNTIFPNYRSHRLPRSPHKSRIVRYADFVQMHAICDFISRSNKPLTIVEVGAHHGAYAILMGRLLKDCGGMIIAIEPDSDNFSVLVRNVKMNNLESTVRCIQLGVLDQPGQMVVSSNGSESQLVNGGSNGAAVEIKTLSQIFAEEALYDVDLLLVDVEGAELPVLQGLPWEKMQIPKIFVELHPYNFSDFGYTGEDFIGFLDERNLRCVDMFMAEHCEIHELDYIGPTVLFTK